MGSVLNDAKKRKLSAAEEDEDVCSSTDASTLDQTSSSAASGCSCSVEMTASGAKSEEEEEEPEDVQLETSSLRRRNSSRREEVAPFGEEEVIEGNDVDLEQSRITLQRRRPAEAELEEFFTAAELGAQEQKKRIVEKYNFDFDVEKPLEGGRFEWVRLSPMKKKKKKIKN